MVKSSGRSAVNGVWRSSAGSHRLRRRLGRQPLAAPAAPQPAGTIRTRGPPGPGNGTAGPAPDSLTGAARPPVHSGDGFGPDRWRAKLAPCRDRGGLMHCPGEGPGSAGRVQCRRCAPARSGRPAPIGHGGLAAHRASRRTAQQHPRQPRCVGRRTLGSASRRCTGPASISVRSPLAAGRARHRRVRRSHAFLWRWATCRSSTSVTASAVYRGHLAETTGGDAEASQPFGRRAASRRGQRRSPAERANRGDGPPAPANSWPVSQAAADHHHERIGRQRGQPVAQHRHAQFQRRGMKQIKRHDAQTVASLSIMRSRVIRNKPPDNRLPASVDRSAAIDLSLRPARTIGIESPSRQ